MATYRVGVIGCGRIGSAIDDEAQGNTSVILPFSHTAAYMEEPRVRVVAAADMDPEKRESYRRRWNVEPIYANHVELLQREKLDIVSVCTRAEERPHVVTACAEAGVKVIFAEKPLAWSLGEAEAMLEACRRHGAKLGVGCLRRWHPFYRQAKQLIDEGVIGKVLQITGYCGSSLSHDGSHWVDLMRFFADDAPVDWLVGEIGDPAALTDDWDRYGGNAYVAFQSGVRGYLRMMGTGAAVQEWDIIGERGRVRALDGGREFELWRRAGGDRTDRPVREAFPRPQRLPSPTAGAVADMVQCLESGKEPECNGEDGYTALEIALAMRESFRRGCARIDFPFEDREARLITPT
ncbi:MAG: Gfo/Idh/MocA family oxidoreductase [Chloroflexota bacterium]|nr:Gfo/Idh/MocA family oxidoreductase [Chloroflexota bacterium]MDE2839687.1 Gfo/Idh/MocA family oxidoreductase [Chloroflexota bacterium]MDE2929367.1 Gfo/Idh/MocA family oxidoreductase [Chloroflexota bacterium]